MIKYAFGLIVPMLIISSAIASQPEGQIVGFLEDGRYEVLYEPKKDILDIPQARWAFTYTKGVWNPFDQSYQNHLSKEKAAKVIHRLATTSCSWHVVMNGKELGQIQSNGLIDSGQRTFWPSPKGWVQRVTNPKDIPVFGSRTYDYEYDQMEPARRPLTLVNKPYYQDPEGWKQVSPIKTIPVEVIHAIQQLPQRVILQEEFKDSDFIKERTKDDIERGTDTLELMMAYPKNLPKEKRRRKVLPEDLALDELWQARDGSRLFGFSFRQGVPEVDLTSESVTNKIYIAWRTGAHPKYLGYTMRLLDIGDYDGDHRSEFLFWFGREDFQGYRISYQNCYKTATSVLINYH